MKKTYYDTREDLDEEYKASGLDETLIRDNTEDLILTETEKEIHVKHTAMPRMEELHVKPLNRITPEIIGGLFDRVKFLEQRIQEGKEMIDIRKTLHDQVIVEIDEDIADKKKMEARAADSDEKRNLKLDISILRKEKRHEQLQFWRDILELKTELRTLMEEHESENKIVNLFREDEENEVRK
jgi:hypothetical protein